MPISDAANDLEYVEHTIESVTESGNYYELRFDHAMCIGCPRVEGIVPKPGDTLRLWGRGFGFTVRGIAINGQIVRYETDAEERDRHARELVESEMGQLAEAENRKAADDARVAALPEVFQRRIQRFRDGNPDFWWKHQSYELFCCEQAVTIAGAMNSPADLQAFTKLEWEQQKRIVPGLDDGHSGNTFGMACRLAHWYLTHPENVEREHGALVPLVGCREYGCTHDEA
jgi:hypothetical protein